MCTQASSTSSLLLLLIIYIARLWLHYDFTFIMMRACVYLQLVPIYAHDTGEPLTKVKYVYYLSVMLWWVKSGQYAGWGDGGSSHLMFSISLEKKCTYTNNSLWYVCAMLAYVRKAQVFSIYIYTRICLYIEI